MYTYDTNGTKLYTTHAVTKRKKHKKKHKKKHNKNNKKIKNIHKYKH